MSVHRALTYDTLERGDETTREVVLARNWRYRDTVRATIAIFAGCFLLLTAASPALARSNRVRQIPNGVDFTCDSCHGILSLSEQHLTPFGVDVNESLVVGNVNWSALWNLDSDGDGLSNGLELGDPSGTWRTGDVDPDAPTANPGVPNQGICGNGAAEPDEACDLDDLQGESCLSLQFGEGTLMCHRLCRWDTSACGFCGDGYLNPYTEECDIEAFAPGLGCADFGFLRGELRCDEDCKVDTSECTDEAPAVCGDGVISRGEFCDGENFGGVDCVRIAYAGGELLCTADCRWDASNCLLADGTRVGDEQRAAEDPNDPGGGDDVGTDPLADDAGNGPALAPAPTGSCSSTGDVGGGWWVLLSALALSRRRRSA